MIEKVISLLFLSTAMADKPLLVPIGIGSNAQVSVQDIRYFEYVLGLIAVWVLKTAMLEAIALIKRKFNKEEKQEDKISDLVNTVHRLEDRFLGMAKRMEEIHGNQIGRSEVKELVRDEIEYARRLQS